MASPGLSNISIAALIIALLGAALLAIYLSQAYIERELPVQAQGGLADNKTAHEITKIDAEIRRIKSDTLGSLFWLKLIALFVTVGGAVGGYLVGQSRSTRERIDFENRKNIDAAYQSIIRELSEEAAVLRAAAAVKLGSVLREFPVEWRVSPERERQLVELTKKVLAAALSIESDPKVLKTLTINIALHRPWTSDEDEARRRLSDLRELDLSGAKAHDAYWARCDFSYSDFFYADLERASLRNSILESAQFRDAKLRDAVLGGARCKGANFKLADLRGADFSDAELAGASFEGARVHGVVLAGATLPEAPEGSVDLSKAGDGSEMQPVESWLAG